MKNIENKQLALLQTVIDSLPMRVFFKDKNSCYMGANKHFLEDAGLQHFTEIVGKYDTELPWTSEQAKLYYDDDQEVISTCVAKINYEEPQLRSDSQEVWLQTNKIPLYDQNKECIGVLGTYEDVTEQVEHRLNLQLESFVDTLTQIPNKRYLHKALKNSDDLTGALILIELDHIYVIHESIGSELGDELIVAVAKRLEAYNNSYSNEFVSTLLVRLSDDSFGIYLQASTTPMSPTLCDTYTKGLLKEITKPYELHEHFLNLGASIGVSMMNAKEHNGEEYFKHAELAMYEAIAKGRNNFQFYNPEMQAQSDRKHRIHVNLLQAIARNELSLVYQAQYNHHDQIIGAEALVRWTNEELGFVPPDQFIQIAENTGLIHPIGKWIIEQALDDLSTMLLGGYLHDNFTLAINISKEQFFHETFIDELKHAVSLRQINPKNIQLEVTESLFIERTDLASIAMLECKALGMSIALDDFGTGYSSLSYLVNLPIDKIKIDRAFVTQLDLNERNKKLISSIVSMADSLNIQVIAEGVENIAERDELISANCLQYQGYLYSHPLSLNDFLHLNSKS